METILPGRVPNENISNHSLLSHNRKKEKISEFISYFIILLFTYASLRVLVDYKMFVKEIYGLTVLDVVKWGLAVICAGELVSVVLLIIPKSRILGLIIAFIFMFVINVAGLIILQKAPLIPPNLFGEIFHGVSFYGHLLINIITLFIILAGIVAQLDSFSRWKI